MWMGSSVEARAVVLGMAGPPVGVVTLSALPLLESLRLLSPSCEEEGEEVGERKSVSERERERERLRLKKQVTHKTPFQP